jgi:hypothetical protein
MGTYVIIQMLVRHWNLTSHPIYKTEHQRMKIASLTGLISRSFMRVWKPVTAVAVVIVALGTADFLCGGTKHPITNALLSICSVGGGTFILVSLLALTYLWPVGVAFAASAVIAQERQRQTWDSLLTTGLDWKEIILVKLAANLRRFNPYSEIFLWVQAFLVVIVFILVIGQFDPFTRSPSLLNLPLAIITMAEFAIARSQEYVIAALIGLMSSLLSSTRESAGVVAVMIAFIMVIARAVMTTLIVVLVLPSTSIPGLIIWLATGPSSVVTLAWRGVGALAILAVMVAVREVIIRLMFGWLIRHLGETQTVPA